MNSFDLFGNPTGPGRRSGHDDADSTDFEVPLEGTGGDIAEESAAPRSFASLIATGAVIAGMLAVQCYNLQVRDAASNRAQAEGNSVRTITVPADRGLITDANGTVIARNSREIALAINPQTFPAKKADREKIYALLKEKAGIEDDAIELIEKNRKESPEIFVIKGGLTKEEQLLYAEQFIDVPGLVLQENPIRLYAEFSSQGHLIGYVGQTSADDVEGGREANEQIGKTGLEKQYDKVLSGEPGKQKAEVNAQGEIVRIVASETNSEPQAGQTLKLNIDLKLQKIVADALAHELERRDKKFGPQPKLGASAVVMDPSTGAVKALVSLPDYSSQLFSGGISRADYANLTSNPGNPLINRAIQGVYPPGSTYKPMVAAAGLESGVITAGFNWTTPCNITLGQFVFPDWKCHNGYTTDVKRAIAESNDVFFYALAGGWEEKNIRGMGLDTLNEYLARFGFGKKTGIDLPAESAGLLPGDEWKRKQIGEKWYIGDTYHASIGQGYVLTTPLQMASTTAAIVNGGTVYQPQVAGSYVNQETGEETDLLPSAIASGIMSAANMATVREGMRQTVLMGSARPLNTLAVTSAGKTGTAQFGINENLHAWYTGFAPYENPQYVFSILIEGGGESFNSSVPVAEEILRGMFNEPLAPGQKMSSTTGVPTDFAGER